MKSYENHRSEESFQQDDYNYEEPLATAIERLNRDLRNVARSLSDEQAAFMVKTYYRIQRERITAGHQGDALAGASKPHEIIDWLYDQSKVLETQIKASLDLYSKNHPFGEWPRNCVYGIGPVITAGLLAHTHIEHLTTAGKICAFAGIVPGMKWEKGQKRPYNADLKLIVWKAADSFVKFKSNSKCFYGKLYEQKKEYYTQKNLNGDYADRAAEKLQKNPNNKEKDYHQRGILSPGHIELMTRRWVGKMFLCHYWEVSYWKHFKVRPPAAYAIGILHHVDYIPPPGFVIPS
jgi:hypothetical protein